MPAYELQPFEYRAADFKDPFALIRKLRSGRSALSKAIWAFFAEDAKEIVLKRGSRREVQDVLEDELHRLIYQAPLYTPERFPRISGRTRQLLNTQRGPGLGFLNALLLHDAYPREIGRPRRQRGPSGAEANAVLGKKWTRAARASHAKINQIALQAHRREAERQLTALGLRPDSWRRVVRVRSPGASLRYHPDALKKLGGAENLEKARPFLEKAALADYALRPEVQRDPVELGCAMQRLHARLRKRGAELEAKAREYRARGGKAAAEKRHAEHEKKKEQYREAYRRQLQSARRQHPRESAAALSPKIVSAMAKVHFPKVYVADRRKAVKRMRDLIQPRAQQKKLNDVH
ncbi:MAG: hypothetical protein ACHQ4J_01900 [Candidatus Binatia bacterium]